MIPRLYSPIFEDEPARPKRKLLPKSLTPEQEATYVRKARDQLDRAREGCAERKKRRWPPCESKIEAARRDLFLVQFLLGTGLRSEEMVCLRVEEIDLAGQSVFVSEGKGRKQRYVPLPDVLVPIVREWLQGRTEGFVARMPQITLYYRVRRLGKLCGFPGIIHPHTLRHTMATRVYEVTRDLRVVQELLGHESIATTQIYAACAPSIRLEAVNLRYRMALDDKPKPA